MTNQPSKVGFIGVGTMGAMLVRSLLRAGRLSATDIWIANRSSSKLESLAIEFNGLHCATANQVAAETQILFLCVKPADTAEVLQQIDNELRPNQICIFLTNVFTFPQIEGRIPCRVVKLIPSLAQRISQGVALLAYGRRIEKADSTALESLLAPIGRLMVVSEHQLRTFADITSCGPAFLSACIEELYRQVQSKAFDLSASDVTAAAVETLAATAELLRSGITPQQIIQEIAVPGGTTAMGLNAIRQYIPQAIAAVLEATERTERKNREINLLDRRP